MIRFKTTKVVLSALVLFFSTFTVAKAQQDGMNTYSPFSIYGFGHMEALGSAVNKSMGGTGIAIKNPIFTNGLNPASLSALPEQTFMFSFGMEGINDYVQSATNYTSNNTFNISELTMQFPIAKRLGFGLTLNPYSYIGYNIRTDGTDEDFIMDVGPYSNYYTGSGGVNLLKASVGWEPIKGLSIGAAALVYHAYLERTTTMSITNMFNPYYPYRDLWSSNTLSFTKISYEVGALYAARLPNAKSLNFGFTYQPKLDIAADRERYIETVTSNFSDTAYYSSASELMVFPEKLSAGISFNTPTLIIAADYIYQDYTNQFELNTTGANVTLTDYQDFRFGVSYTPNRFDVRKAMSRWTYRAGARYGTSYLAVNDNKINDYSLTLGAGIPLQPTGLMHLNLSLEVGQRGTITSNDFKETYVKFAVGVNFFVVNEWFIRHKFQ